MIDWPKFVSSQHIVTILSTTGTSFSSEVTKNKQTRFRKQFGICFSKVQRRSLHEYQHELFISLVESWVFPLVKLEILASAHIIPTLSGISNPLSARNTFPGNSLFWNPLCSLMYLSLVRPTHASDITFLRQNANQILNSVIVFIWWPCRSSWSRLEGLWIYTSKQLILLQIFSKLHWNCFPQLISTWPIYLVFKRTYNMCRVVKNILDTVDVKTWNL